ncbi:MAG: DUF2236 domain-containing protein [Rhodobacteraceae bacterium]|nr:DUF2236 domain-containing protein [Paracoccaceae bacterium]MYG42409.1 DUF2236 domain-containing protein [Paracoccaceae bacterium]
MFNCPTAYAEGFKKARVLDQEFADNYIRHTRIGDLELDPVMEELWDLPTAEMHRFIRAGVEQVDDDDFRSAPKALRDFFEHVKEVPEWVDFDEFKPAQRAFFHNMGNLLIAYAIGSAVEGFSTLVSKSFSITGRVTGLGPGAERRLRQNNRHMVETYYPDGLRRNGEGWKIAMRIRFVHARIRKLLADSEYWDHDAWGTPLSAAHLGGISLFTFSIRQFEHAISMGSSLTDEEQESIVKIWRYDGHILGVPDTILFKNEAEARKMYKIAHLCEPPPDESAVEVATAVFKAIPAMAGVKTERERKSLQMYAFRLSRALIGNELADFYGYPNTIRVKSLVLLYYRLRKQLINFMKHTGKLSEEDFSLIFESTQYDKEGISYKLPDHVRATQQSPW